jgi:hypothetical protein
MLCSSLDAVIAYRYLDVAGVHVGLQHAAPGLPGTLPGAAWRNLTRLTWLSVMYNALTGTLPPELAATSPHLGVLYLDGNSFTGAS